MNLKRASPLQDSFIPCILQVTVLRSCELTPFLQEGLVCLTSNKWVKSVGIRSLNYWQNFPPCVSNVTVQTVCWHYL